jgi:predicted transcriptional regulator
MAVPDRGPGLFGPLEANVMEVVWAAARPVTVRQVLEALNRTGGRQLAYTTVMTVMTRLAEKGILRRDVQGRGYVYEAAAGDAAAIAVRNVLRDFGDAAVAHFVDEARADPRILRRLQRLMDEPS